MDIVQYDSQTDIIESAESSPEMNASLNAPDNRSLEPCRDGNDFIVQSMLNVLNSLQMAVFVISPDGTLELANSAAESILERKDAVWIDRQGKIKSNSVKSEPNLGEQIEELLEKQHKNESGYPTDFLIERGPRNSPYLVKIIPHTSSCGMNQPAGAVIIIINPDDKKKVNTSGLKKMYGLSKAETRICQLLVEGMPPKEISSTRNVAPSTVKNQINSLLAKTGSRSRSDLTRQVLSISLPIGEP